MTAMEMAARISDLETALRLVIFVWVTSVVLLSFVKDGDCEHCPHCQGLAKIPRCPMCLKKHETNERCG